MARYRARAWVLVNTDRAVMRCDRYVARLNDDLTARWPAVVSACILNVLERTPDPITEYRYIQGYEGGVFFAGAGGRKSKSAAVYEKHGRVRKIGQRRFPASNILGDVFLGTETSSRRGLGDGKLDNRISFIRSPGLWLDEMVEHEENRVVEYGEHGIYSIGLGVVSIMEEMTRFSWQNYSSRRGIGSPVHTSEYGMWSFFEYGKSGTQSPRWGAKDYKLKPYVNQEQWYWSTLKFYPRKAMYSDFPSNVFTDLVVSIIEQVKF